MKGRKEIVHITTGFVMFVVVALSAVVLHLGMLWLTSWGLPYVILLGLRLAEYSVFLFDVFLLLRFLVETIVEILWPWRAGLVPSASPAPPAHPSEDA